MYTKDDEIEIKGCNPVIEIIKPDKELRILLNNLLNSIKEKNNSFTLERIPYKESLSISKEFMDDNFKLHEITFINKKTIGILNKKITIFKTYNKHPYNLKIIKDIEGPVGGELEETVLDKIYFNKIHLPKISSELTPAIYAHELVHTQLDSNKGVYKNYYYSEILSILVEYIINSRKENITKFSETDRIFELNVITNELLEDREREDKIESCKYLVSSLIALNLYIIYYNSNNNLKKEMLTNIQKVFDYEITLEEFLDIYEVSFTSSQDEKKLKKFLLR